MESRKRLVDFDRTHWRRQVSDYPFLYADQDVFNAIVAARVDSSDVTALDHRLSPSIPFDGLEVVDEICSERRLVERAGSLRDPSVAVAEALAGARLRRRLLATSPPVSERTRDCDSGSPGIDPVALSDRPARLGRAQARQPARADSLARGCLSSRAPRDLARARRELSSRAAFYCVSSAEYFLGAVAMINSLRLNGHREPIYLLDAGLSDDQRQLLAAEVTIVKAPDGVEPFMLKAVAPLAHPAEVVVLIDADMIVTRNLGELIERAHGSRIIASTAAARSSLRRVGSDARPRHC